MDKPWLMPDGHPVLSRRARGYGRTISLIPIDDGSSNFKIAKRNKIDHAIWKQYVKPWLLSAVFSRREGWDG